MPGIVMDDTPYNACYAKPCRPVGDRQFDCPQLIRSNGCKRAARCYLFNGGLILAKQMEQESGRDIFFRRKSCKTTPNAHLSVRDINDADRGSDTNQDIARFRQFRWGICFDRGMLQEQIAEIYLPLMEFCSFGFIQRLTDRRLSHVYA